MRRFRFVILGSVGVLLAGCGSGGNSSASAVAGAPAPPAPTTLSMVTAASVSPADTPGVTIATPSAAPKGSATESTDIGGRKLSAGCAAGPVLAQHDAGGVLIRIVNRSFGVDLCMKLPDGEVVHAGRDGMTAYALDAKPFADGSYFRTDSLGHVFTRFELGTVSGITVVAPSRTGAQVFDFDEATLDTRTEPYRVTTQFNDCDPDCAAGHVTIHRLGWDPSTRSYR